MKLFLSTAAKGADQLELFRADFSETGVEIQNRTKNGHRHSGHNDGSGAGAQPYDQKGGQG